MRNGDLCGLISKVHSERESKRNHCLRDYATNEGETKNGAERREKGGEEWRGEWRTWQSHTHDRAVDSTTTLPQASASPSVTRHSLRSASRE